MILNMLIKFFSVSFLFFCMAGCLNVEQDSRLSIADQTLMTDYIQSQKKKLPRNLDCCTTWIDVYQSQNKLIYLYQVNADNMNENQILEIKNKHYSKPKIDEICGMIIDVFESPVEFEYRIINNKKEELLKMSFTQELCS